MRGILSLSGALAITLSTAATAADLNVTAYGGIWEQAFRTCVVAPFEKQSGKSVNVVLGTPAQWLNQISANPSRPPIDILMISSDGAFDAIHRNLIEKNADERLPNLAEIAPRFREFTQDRGMVFAYGAMGIAYNADVVKTPPESWEDFVQGTIKGKWQASIPGVNLGASAMMTTVWMLSDLNGGGIDNVDPAFSRIQAMRQAGNLKFWSNANEFLSQLGSGDIDIGMYWDGRAWAYIGDGHPNIKFYNPKPGAVVAMTWVQKVKGSPDFGWDFMNIALSADAQSCYGNKMAYGMSNTKTRFSDEVKPKVTRLDEVIIGPFDKTAAKLPQWVERWNKEIR